MGLIHENQKLLIFSTEMKSLFHFLYPTACNWDFYLYDIKYSEGIKFSYISLPELYIKAEI